MAIRHLEQSDFETLAWALTAQVHCAYAYAAASHADAWLAEHFQKQNALAFREMKYGIKGPSYKGWP